MRVKKKLSAIILAAGAGTRLRSEIPKALHEICGEPILVHLLRTIKGLVDGKTVVVVGFAHEKVEQALKERGFRKIHYALQAKQLGTGHAVLCAADHFDRYTGDILVLVGDAPMWERVKILKWARDLKPCDPNKARAALWEVFQEHNDPDAPCTPARVR